MGSEKIGKPEHGQAPQEQPVRVPFDPVQAILQRQRSANAFEPYDPVKAVSKRNKAAVEKPFDRS